MKKLFLLLLPVAIFTLFICLPDLIEAETTAHYYHDNLWVDLKIGDGGDGKKYELYRDSGFVYFWENQTDAGVYYTDTPGAE